MPPLSRVGSELAPSATAPLGARLTSVVLGEHVEVPPLVTVLLKHVSRRKMPLEVFTGLVTRLVEVEANATNSPVWLTDGPAVARVGVPPTQVAPQIPVLACVASGARSTIKGRPPNSLPFTAKVSGLEVPPPEPPSAGLVTFT